MYIYVDIGFPLPYNYPPRKYESGESGWCIDILYKGVDVLGYTHEQSMQVCIYAYVCIYICVCIYMHTYICV